MSMPGTRPVYDEDRTIVSPSTGAFGPTYNSLMSPMSLEDRVRKVVEHAPPDVLAVYLYGSRARGTALPTSDVDLGVLLRAAPPPTLGGVARDLDDAVERAVRVPVEVVVLNRAAADLTHR